MGNLEEMCIEYMTTVYKMFRGNCDGVHIEILDNKRVELHNQIVEILKISYNREPELNRILHSLNVHINFPMNEYATAFHRLSTSSIQEYGRKLCILLEKEFGKKD